MAKKAITIDLESDAPSNQSVRPDDLAAVIALADEARGIQSWIDEMHRRLNDKCERLEQIEQHQLPELMTQIGMKQFQLASGETVSIKDIVRASIPSQTSIEKADGPERAALEERRKRSLAASHRSPSHAHRRANKLVNRSTLT
jgi:hypothetical protein